jgi:hypothetical protein
MTKELFAEILQTANETFCPIFATHGVGCNITGDWDSTIITHMPCVMMATGSHICSEALPVVGS